MSVLMGGNGVLLDAFHTSCDVAEVFHIKYALPNFISCGCIRHCKSNGIVMVQMLRLGKRACCNIRNKEPLPQTAAL